MPVAKKDKTRPKKEKKPAQDDSSEDDVEDDEEELEVESAAMKKKKEKGRKAFMRLMRKILVLVPLGVVLTQQPFMQKPREPGVNRGKIVPLQLAVSGAVHWAKASPTVLRNPKIEVYINQTARVLLTPGEYVNTYTSKRATEREKTWAKAYDKTAKKLGRIVDSDSQLKNIAIMPMPNLPLIGSGLILLGCLVGWFVPGAEYLIVGGCFAVRQGSVSLGMEPQPEMYVTGAVALIGCFLMDAAGKKEEPAKRKRR